MGWVAGRRGGASVHGSRRLRDDVQEADTRRRSPSRRRMPNFCGRPGEAGVRLPPIFDPDQLIHSWSQR